MAKVMFDILLPSTGRHYDFWVPEDMQMQTVTQLIAEGIETEAQLRTVIGLGVDLLQGYCLAPPAAEPGAIDEKAAEVIAEVERQKAEREEAGS